MVPARVALYATHIIKRQAEILHLGFIMYKRKSVEKAGNYAER